MNADEFYYALGRREFSVHYQRTQPGWTGNECDYAPIVVMVCVYDDEGNPLPEDEWLGYEGFELETTLDQVYQDLTSQSVTLPN